MFTSSASVVLFSLVDDSRAVFDAFGVLFVGVFVGDDGVLAAVSAGTSMPVWVEGDTR